MENEDPNNTELSRSSHTRWTHTHLPWIKKQKDLPEDAEKEQKVADKHQRDTSGNPWEKPSENKNTVKKDS